MNDNIECPRCHNIFPKQNQIMHDARCTEENPMALDESRKIQLNELNNQIKEQKKPENNSVPIREEKTDNIPKNQNLQVSPQDQPPLKKFSDSGEFPNIFVCDLCGETLAETEKNDHMYCHNLQKEEERNRNNQNDLQVSQREIERQKQIEEMIKHENDLRRQTDNRNQRQNQQNNRIENNNRNNNPNLFGNNPGMLDESDMNFFRIQIGKHCVKLP